MPEIILGLPIQETGYVDETCLGESEHFNVETKPTSMDSLKYDKTLLVEEDPKDYNACTNYCVDHKSIPSIIKFNQETQTDNEPYENSPEPVVVPSELEEVDLPVSSDVVDQQESSLHDGRKDGRKRRRRRKRRPVKEQEEIVASPSNDPKPQSRAALPLPGRAFAGFFNLAKIGIMFIFLIGLSESSSLPSMTGECHAYSFITNDSLFNTHLILTKYLDILCEIPKTNSTINMICRDNKSEVVLINSTFLVLVTKEQNHIFYLEFGHMRRIRSKPEGSFNNSKEAREYFVLNKDFSQPTTKSPHHDQTTNTITWELALVGTGSCIGVMVFVAAIYLLIIHFCEKKCQRNSKSPEEPENIPLQNVPANGTVAEENTPKKNFVI